MYHTAVIQFVEYMPWFSLTGKTGKSGTTGTNAPGGNGNTKLTGALAQVFDIDIPSLQLLC